MIGRNPQLPEPKTMSIRLPLWKGALLLCFLGGVCLFAFRLIGSSIDHDEFADLDLRTTFGAGAGHQFFESDDLNLSVSAGLAYIFHRTILTATRIWPEVGKTVFPGPSQKPSVIMCRCFTPSCSGTTWLPDGIHQQKTRWNRDRRYESFLHRMGMF
jgi:hypothetical protein